MSMNTLSISYLNHTLHVVSANDGLTLALPEGATAMDDSRWEDCFALLREGQDVWVACNHGIRNLNAYLKTHYRYVKAAGGVVETPQGEVLTMSREGQWDLPKGMVERGETLAQAALREVEEETGVGNATIKGLITKTYHIFDKYGGWHLKQTSWFAMQTDRQACVPQKEEGITEVMWLPREECLRRLSTSYASLRLVGIELTRKHTEH